MVRTKEWRAYLSYRPDDRHPAPPPARAQAGEVVWEYKEGTEILRTYHKRDIDAVADPAAREAIVTYSYMLDDDIFGSTPTPEEDTSYYFNHSCAPNCWCVR